MSRITPSVVHKQCDTTPTMLFAHKMTQKTGHTWVYRQQKTHINNFKDACRYFISQRWVIATKGERHLSTMTAGRGPKRGSSLEETSWVAELTGKWSSVRPAESERAVWFGGDYNQMRGWPARKSWRWKWLSTSCELNMQADKRKLLSVLSENKQQSNKMAEKVTMTVGDGVTWWEPKGNNTGWRLLEVQWNDAKIYQPHVLKRDWSQLCKHALTNRGPKKPKTTLKTIRAWHNHKQTRNISHHIACMVMHATMVYTKTLCNLLPQDIT